MPEGLEQAVEAFATEVSPGSRPRDEGGRFRAVASRPEPMFSERTLEGDPETGDTRDAGDDPRLRALEKEVTDGQVDERDGRTTQNRQELRRTAPDEGYDPGQIEPEDIWTERADDDANLEGADEHAIAEGDRRDAEGPSERDAAAQKYEVMVDGSPQEVTLEEALRGYVRQATFHQRVSELNNVRNEIENDSGRLSQNWQIWDKARRDWEEDVSNMLPTEPNWDQEFARDPRAAHDRQKIFQALYAKLAASQQARAMREAYQAEETNRRIQKYAVEGFARFVSISKIPDEATLKKDIRAMRQTAMNAGFTEYEVATVYDPRMLVILRKAMKYDRIQANRPRPVVSGQGKSLPPGAATPFGNVRRAGFDEAARRLARSGKLDDAAEVFRRLF